MNATQYQLLMFAAERMLARLPDQELTFTLTAEELQRLRERRALLQLDRETDAVQGIEHFKFSLPPAEPEVQDVSDTTNEADQHAHR